MKPLRKGDRGPDVLALQQKLTAADHGTIAGHKLAMDSRFGDATEQTLRAFQIDRGLSPDGVAGPITLKALENPKQSKDAAASSPIFNRFLAMLGGTVTTAALFAKNTLPSSNHVSFHPVHLHTSEKGLRFIYTGEAQKNVSNRLHWPSGASGVTLGPGYDMGWRSALVISADLQKIGTPKAVADKVAKAAGLKSLQAELFIKNNPDLVKLVFVDDKQEMALLKHIVPNYEGVVRHAINIDLFQHQFDALVSVAYNLGSIPGPVASAINRGEVTKAMQTLNGYTRSGVDAKHKSLVHRRGREVALYLYNDYGMLRNVT